MPFKQRAYKRDCLSLSHYLQLSVSRALDSLARLARFEAAFMILVPTDGWRAVVGCYSLQQSLLRGAAPLRLFVFLHLRRTGNGLSSSSDLRALCARDKQLLWNVDACRVVVVVGFFDEIYSCQKQS